MPRKGYGQEYWAKTELQRIYGKHNIIRTACKQNVPDFIAIKKSINGDYMIDGFEVKSTVEKKWYPQQRDRKQLKANMIWSVATGAKVYYWLIYRRKPKNITEEYTIDEFRKKFMERR
jgi:Holliday junction resolvase